MLLPAYDEDHPDIGDVDDHLGEALRRLGRTEEARTALLHALRIRGRHGDHPDAVGTLIRLGRLHRDTGGLEQSYERLRHARRMAAAVMGPDHPYVAGSAGVRARLGQLGPRFPRPLVRLTGVREAAQTPSRGTLVKACTSGRLRWSACQT
ncbi:tetratricopeptide repeat protein [Streptomyces sp. NPDC006385]|uniref:tetratricopeptide repeat protein n=1 Tax=Streptomyces sp. NPDC006385 TaxID=3156761 RepID=UPI0033BA23FC